MMNKMVNHWIKVSLTLFGIIFLIYGGIRAYYALTDGFTIDNITSNYSYDERWNTRPITPQEKEDVDGILDQSFHYMGKGCQSYVFVSQDGKYILKFFKYQRFRTKPWVKWFSFIPAVNHHRLERRSQKIRKLEALFASWKIAFDELKEESGLVYVHLNKTPDFGKKITIHDKRGNPLNLDIDNFEWLIQKKATMITDSIDTLVSHRESMKAKELLDNLVTLLMSEYQRGLSDNDPALMQNTGVFENSPIHVDVGQFVFAEKYKDPKVHRQLLYNKMYKFRHWLKVKYPDLLTYLDHRLYECCGPEFFSLTSKYENL
jgi:hypothetical protein